MDDHENKNGDAMGPVSIGPGQTILKYTVVEKIGAGGMGEVFLADDSLLRRQVALKFLPPNLLTEPEFRDRFQREAMAAARLSHSNIITVYDTGEFEGRPYIAMEYFSGRSLKALIREKTLSCDEIVRIGSQIADALAEAHRAGITHRDVKSENILINDVGTVKILDFGLARLEEEAGLTQTGTALGTVSYMSPEQVQGQEVDFRTDLFSMGVVLFELATGQLPFKGDNIAAIANAIITREPDRPCALNQEITDVLQGIILKLMSKSPKDRISSAAEVAAELAGLMSGPVDTVTRPTTPARHVGRRWWWGIATVVLVTTLAVIYFSQRSSQVDQPDRRILAVMPFENLGSQEDSFFAAGITDEVTTHLTKLSGLGVISRSSTKHLQSEGKTVKDVGVELGADYVLEGSVRWDNTSSPKKVRITSLLKEVPADVTLWGETYDRLVTDIFAVQTDIARKVAAAMDVALLENEKQTLDQIPTASIDAYTFYLQGLDYFGHRDWELAQQMFVRATEIDTTFASAWAMLSRTHSLMFWWYVDRSDERLELARITAERSLALEPSSPEAHIAMGRYFYRGHLDFDMALEHYEQALAMQPSNSDLLFAIGSVFRRQAKWDDAITKFQEAVTLDPRSLTKLRNLCNTHLLMRDFQQALTVSDGLTALAPNEPAVLALRARIMALGYGNVTEAIRVLENYLPTDSDDEIIDALTAYFVLGSNPQRAASLLQRFRRTSYFQRDSAYYFLQLGEAAHLSGDAVLAGAVYDSAARILQTQVQSRPDEAYYRSALGIAHAGLGRDQEAIREGVKATELYPVEIDARAGTSWRLNLAIIYAMVGRDQLALEEMQYLLSVPSEVTRAYLELHPIFEGVRELPEYSNMLVQE